jgi:hypothetical protein
MNYLNVNFKLLTDEEEGDEEQAWKTKNESKI